MKKTPFALGLNPLLERKTERIGQTGEQREEKADVDRFLDSGIGNACTAHPVQVCDGDRLRVKGQLLQESKRRTNRRGDRRTAPVFKDGGDDLRFSTLYRNCGMGRRSVATAI